MSSSYLNDYTRTRNRSDLDNQRFSRLSSTRCLPTTPAYRHQSEAPSGIRSSSLRSLIRNSFTDHGNDVSKLQTSKSIRDDLIDSLLYTRTREHRPLPGELHASNWEERLLSHIDCDKVFPGIIIGNAATIKDINYLRRIGVTHVLNTAERHVEVNPSVYPLHGISYYGFHVDDTPKAYIYRYFHSTSEYLSKALSSPRNLVVVNCMMGWSRSATIVAAYLISKKRMKASEALEMLKKSRPIRPNPGFLQQLADYENSVRKYIF